MAERFVATFDSLRPARGVVVDEEAERFAGFPTLELAQRAAASMNRLELVEGLPHLSRNLAWRSIVTGERIEPESDDLGAES